jgi:hypothetical protein
MYLQSECAHSQQLHRAKLHLRTAEDGQRRAVPAAAFTQDDAKAWQLPLVPDERERLAQFLPASRVKLG